MDYQFFDSLSANDAQDFLRNFLDVERVSVESMTGAAYDSGLEMDYSIETLPSVLKWIVKDLRILRTPVPETEPDWIREAHPKGLIEFDDASRRSILMAAYYMGESFVRSYTSLRWATGKDACAEKNMPVVSGFESSCEMAPAMIIENLCKRVFGSGAKLTDIDKAVASWAQDAVSI